MAHKFKFRPSLFWDVDVKMIDKKRHARYVIERVLEFGNDDEVRWLFRSYSRKTLQNALRRSRGALHDKTKKLWSRVLERP